MGVSLQESRWLPAAAADACKAVEPQEPAEQSDYLYSDALWGNCLYTVAAIGLRGRAFLRSVCPKNVYVFRTHLQ